MLRINTNYYRISEDLKLEELKYVGKDGNKHIFHDQYLAEVRLALHSAEQLNLSRIMVLNDLEEMLRYRINLVHDLLRRAKQKFNPLDTVTTITTVKNSSAKEIHQYDRNSGKYLNSYPTITSAVKTVTGDYGKIDKGNIAGCARGERPTAFGYMWSYTKQIKIPVNHLGKEVHQYSKSGEYIDSYPSAKLAVLSVTGKNSCVTGISHCCTGKRFSSYGFRWSSKKVQRL